MGDSNQTFTKEVIGKGKADAVQTLYSDLGSKHKVKRRNIKLKKVTEIPLDKVKDPIIRFKAGGKND
jgi:large subunit ribosomal protein LX